MIQNRHAALALGSAMALECEISLHRPRSVGPRGVFVAGRGPPPLPPRIWVLMCWFSAPVLSVAFCENCLGTNLQASRHHCDVSTHVAMSMHRRAAPQARRLLVGSCCDLCSRGEYTQVAARGSWHNVGASPAGAPPLCCTRGATSTARTMCHVGCRMVAWRTVVWHVVS